MGCKISASELGSKYGIMRDFQKGITLEGWVSKSVYIVGLQKWVAKKFEKFSSITNPYYIL